MDSMNVMNDIHSQIDYKVLVCCMTYNQSLYIVDALNGFAMQQTDFPFACLVMDDASTDGEQDIIQNYIDKECNPSLLEECDTDESRIVVAPHRTNCNCWFVCYFLKKNLFETKLKESLKEPWFEKCEYVALCEGDDYWTDECKLQKQVAFLDENPDISLSCCRYGVCHIEKKVVETMPNPYFELEHKGKECFTFNRNEAFLGKAWLTKTPTCVYRRCAFHQEFINQFKYARDVHLFYDLLSTGNGVCHSFVGAVYRITGQGIYGGKSDLEHNKIDYNVYSELYSIVKDPIIKSVLYRLFCNLIYAREWPPVNTLLSVRMYLRFLLNKAKSLKSKL